MKSVAQLVPRAKKWQNQGIKTVTLRPVFLKIFVNKKKQLGMGGVGGVVG